MVLRSPPRCGELDNDQCIKLVAHAETVTILIIDDSWAQEISFYCDGNFSFWVSMSFNGYDMEIAL